ncbi:MAG TPA: hypothetical protein VMT66_01100 [Steroidobacteraceae bacterium]|nr:hypothetical protein [Steroidobacteraceae bacterium]
MAKASKATTATTATTPDLGQSVRDHCDLLLTLKPAELEALLLRLCACSTRRVRSGEPRRAPRRCRGRVATEWCRLGARATAGYVGTRFG